MSKINKYLNTIGILKKHNFVKNIKELINLLRKTLLAPLRALLENPQNPQNPQNQLMDNKIRVFLLLDRERPQVGGRLAWVAQEILRILRILRILYRDPLKGALRGANRVFLSKLINSLRFRVFSKFRS